MLKPSHPRNRCQLWHRHPRPWMLFQGRTEPHFRAQREHGSMASPLLHSTTRNRQKQEGIPRAAGGRQPWASARGTFRPRGQKREGEGQNRLAERHEGRRTTPSLTGQAQGLSLGWEWLETKESRTNNRSICGCFGTTKRTCVVRSQHPRNLKGMRRTSILTVSSLRVTTCLTLPCPPWHQAPHSRCSVTAWGPVGTERASLFLLGPRALHTEPSLPPQPTSLLNVTLLLPGLFHPT